MPKESEREGVRTCGARIPGGVVRRRPKGEPSEEDLRAAGAQNTHLIVAAVLVFYTPKRMRELQSIREGMIAMLQRKVEEILEAIWTAGEKGSRSREQVQEDSQVDLDEAGLKDLQDRGLIALKEDGIHLTSRGKEEAEHIVRRHRLAERLLNDVLGVKAEEAESDACEFEHATVPEVTESICTLLGHPKECPHGSPIPEGKCCKEARRVVEKVVVSLDRLNSGEEACIAYINTRKHARLHKLVAFGLCPGVIVKVHQKLPSFVIQYDQTQLALEADVAADIFVWRSSEN